LNLHVTLARTGDALTVRVAGRLGAEGVAELERACGDPDGLRLDLSELVTADEEGTRLLVRLRNAGAELAEIPPYVDLLLRARSARNP
jgi:hypothetical protein